MSRRSRSREVAVQLIYESRRNSEVTQERIQGFIENRLQSEVLRQFAAELVLGVQSNREELDQVIQSLAQNWRLDRIAPVDLSILCLATYEIIFRLDIPQKVAIDEAIELAKRYGTADSARFVNGILDGVMETHPRHGGDDGQGNVERRSDTTDRIGPIPAQAP